MRGRTARKNGGHAVTFAFQINYEYFLSISPILHVTTYVKNVLSEMQISLGILYWCLLTPVS